MYEYRIAYRFTNNDVEGFTGIAFDENKAREHAIQKVKNKIEFVDGEPLFDESRLITNNDQCTPNELESIGRDWHVSVLSRIT